MRSNQPQPLRGLIKQVLESCHIDEKVVQAGIRQQWNTVVGSVVAKHTLKLTLHKGVLCAELDSSIVRNELRMLKSKIIEEINHELGQNIIKDLILK